MKSSAADYTVSVTIRSNIETVFNALSKNLTFWWGNMDRPVETLDDIFTVSWGTPWYQFKVIDYRPHEKITWACIDANQIIPGLEGVKKEWVGSTLHWTIDQLDPMQIKVSLTHQGLTPQLVCYEVCSTTWDRFITDSLKTYLEGQS